MTNFDWRTDEEKGWDQPAAGGPSRPEGRSLWRVAARLARRRWRGLLAALFLLAAAGALGARTVQMRVRAVEEATLAEVRAAHDLLLDAAQARDEELLLSMLGGDRSWRRAQRAALEEGALFGRSELGMTWLAQEEPLVDVELSPDLQQALVTSTLQYEGYAGGDALQRIALQQFLRFEKVEAQWRLAPHDQTEWDGWVTDDDEQFLTVFPRRDETIGARLTEDIRAALAALCSGLAECPARLHLQLRFELNYETLHLPTIWINGMRRDSFTLALPAPSLVGLPADEAGYRALRNAYLRTIAGQLIDAFAQEWAASSSAMRAAQRRQVFADLDLIAWPPAAQSGAASPGTVGSDILTVCVDGAGKGDALLRYDAAVGTWTTELQGRNVMEMAGLDVAPGVLLREQRETERRTGEPEPYITWWGDGRELARFDGYYLGDSVPSSAAFIAGTPDGQNYWVYLGNASECNGFRCRGVVIHEEPTTWSPNGRHTLFRRELEGSRSPPAADDMLWLGDASGNAAQRLGEGFYPFWIDDKTFGYLVVPRGREQTFAFDYELVVRRLEGETVSEPRSLPLHMVEALQQLAPVDEDVEEMGVAVSHVFAHPSRPNTIYILGVRFTRQAPVNAAPQHSVFLFAADAQSGEVTVRVPSEQMQWTGLPRLSPDGRWLAYLGHDWGSRQSVVAIHDLTAEPERANVYERRIAVAERLTGQAVRPYDWSWDGELLILENGVLHIVNPRSGQAQQLVPPTPACAYAAWAE